VGRRLRSLWRPRGEPVVDHRLRDRAGRPARLAHRCHEETQYIIAGKGELQTEDRSYPVGPGSVFVLPTNVRHNLANVGTDRLRAVAFFAAAMFTQNFDNLMLPPKSHILGTPNREG